MNVSGKFSHTCKSTWVATNLRFIYKPAFDIHKILAFVFIVLVLVRSCYNRIQRTPQHTLQNCISSFRPVQITFELLILCLKALNSSTQCGYQLHICTIFSLTNRFTSSSVDLPISIVFASFYNNSSSSFFAMLSIRWRSNSSRTPLL